ncbi:MAG: crossover junction endodeoxyribonuclease RuvC [Gammaproteobacteria bacterium]|nr:crossover junction endodeoxyribonuclease RuvC [Gammaproteobacteria bacterium]MDX5374582.1 crossover junction endodeoxyribonuclease RuvC [Gammaproteobacteria bacterium]
MIRILGIDPGSRITGYGIIDSDGRRSRHVASGCIRVTGDTLPERLGMIYREVGAVLGEHMTGEGAMEMAIENVFVSKNASSALKLGQARGAAICAGVSHALTVAEYTPTEVKLAIVGTGGADKAQVQHMVRMLLGLKGPLQADTADALAVALCHAHTGSTLARVPALSGRRR